jgi:phosphohistidine swiveling domain-containing protein
MLSPEQMQTQINNLHSKGQDLLRSLQSEKLNILVPLMIKGGTFRDRNKASLGYTIKYKHKIFDEISKRELENRDNLNYYLLSEILNLLDSGVKVSADVLETRKRDGVVLVRSEYLDILKDFKVMDLKLPGSTIQESKSQTLKGRCACSGYVEGVAKIIYTKEDSPKVKEGDILVAIGTDFDLMDAIHRSAGIITEEGGLLSHASVVSREMKKPCIIGVSNATSLIKDGDHLILDSKKGIITIK